MILIVIADDTSTRQRLAKGAIKVHARGSANFISYKDKHPTLTELLELGAQSNDLFSQGTVVLLFETLTLLGEEIVSEAKTLHSSKTLFVFLESETASVVDNLKKVHAEIIEAPKRKAITKKDNPFVIANAVGTRDRMSAWMTLYDLYGKDTSPEAIAGILFWKVKSLLLENNFKKYSREELEAMVEALPRLIHEGRRSGEDLSVGLESFILRSI